MAEPLDRDEERLVIARETPYLDICERGDTVVIAIRDKHVGVSTLDSAETHLRAIRKDLNKTSLRGGLVVDIDIRGGGVPTEIIQFLYRMIRVTRRGIPRGPIGRLGYFHDDVRVAFCSPQSKITAVFHVLRFDEVVPIFETLDEAVRAVSRRPPNK